MRGVKLVAGFFFRKLVHKLKYSVGSGLMNCQPAVLIVGAIP